MVVSVESVSTIVPAVPTPQPCTLWLCNFQIQVLAENYLKQVYYYPAALDHVSSFDSLVASLKDSLSRILVPYYPLAGRPRIAGLDRPILECNDRGIEFVVAFADASFGDWGDSMKQCSIEQELNPAQTAITDPENFPQLKVQVTKFRCGGIALGLVTTHTLLDGSSVFPFLKAWSQLHRGFPPPNPPPSFDSSLLKARDPPCVTVPVRDFVAVTPAIAEEMGKAAQDFKPSYHVRAFHMNEQQLAELKHEIASGPFAYGSSPTSFEAVSGLVWKCITEARDFDDSVTNTYIYAVSTKVGRNRWQPPMPSEYCGTSSFTLCLPCAVGALKNKHVSHAARLFHEDVRNVGQERIQSTIDWMEETLRKGHDIGLNVPPPSTGMGIYSVNLHSFPVYHGSSTIEKWAGRPHPNSNSYGNGVVVLLPTPQGGMREHRIVVMLLEEQMKRLLQSELFARFTTLDC
ncbi:rosmarinate synthase isoform X3 [Selaginella moellendorffii]|uniref:rosmarinate synthase isoform X3 n=1 Tax=Selaginella moellendorffii TaxID=88036 RepID=UPI000D1C8CA1|nr:rosmarinate synthase isoform X3 [Selaginella moellendorffii]|eukprot:XP_024524911.1 rosmarinate synthase isoform X3 [Selaginella moellendorffii]